MEAEKQRDNNMTRQRQYDDDSALDARARHTAERLFWVRSQPFLRAGPRVDLSDLWRTCRDEARRTEQTVGDGFLTVLAGYKAPPVGPVLEIKTVTLDLELKGDDYDGSVEGYASTFGNLDLVKDIIHQGAFARTLVEAKGFARTHATTALWPLLWQHDKLDPIGGIVDAREDGRGLAIACRINRDIEHGRAAYDGLKQGYLAFSIGYKPVKYEWKASVRHLTEIALGEVSVVTFPANPEARATGTGAAA